MDPNLIYVKTATGEDAIQQRTRVIQRNVRMVLILVDGHSSVADLSRKTGNPQLTENALAELEKGGFIEQKLEQHDSLWEESKRVAQEIRSAAIEKATQFSRKDTGEKYPDFKQSAPPARSLSDFGNQPSEMPISLHSVFDAKDEAEFSVADLSLAPSDPLQSRPVPKKDLAEMVRNFQPERKTEKGPPPAKPSFFAQLVSLWRGADRELEEEPVKLKPIRREGKSRPSWPAAVLIGLVGIVVLGALAAVLVPLDVFLPDVENALTRAVGRPAKIATMRVEFQPTPALVLGDVRLGQGKEELRVREIRLLPDVMTLLSPRKRFHKATLRGLGIELERFPVIPSAFAALSASASPVEVASVLVEDTSLSVGNLTVRGMEGELKRQTGGSISLRSADKSLNIRAASRSAAQVEITVEAAGWRPQEGSRFLVDSATFGGKLENGVLALSAIDLRLFDGVVRGSATIRSEGKPNLSGDVTFERINTAKLGDALAIGKRVVGDVSGRLRFSATSEAWATVFSALSAEGDFSMQRGSLTGVDLAEAVRRVSATPVQGGTTAFEQLTGRVKLAPERTQFFNLAMNSGLMQSSGQIEVGKERKLSGRLDLQMKGSVNQTRVPVIVGGTLDSPSVQSGR